MGRFVTVRRSVIGIGSLFALGLNAVGNVLTGVQIWHWKIASGWWQFASFAAFVIVILYLLVEIEQRLKNLPSEGATDAISSADKEALKVARHRRGILQSWENALITAAVTRRYGGAREAERDLAQVRAALLSAHKLFGLPLPPEGETDAMLELEADRRFMEKVKPYLDEGHDEEAVAVAQDFCRALGSQV